MFWLSALTGALKSNNDQTNANTINGMQSAANESNNILQKRQQRSAIADNVGANKGNVDIDAIVSSLFPNKKKAIGGFSNNGIV
jgi:hypothetical protein